MSGVARGLADQHTLAATGAGLRVDPDNATALDDDGVFGAVDPAHQAPAAQLRIMDRRRRLLNLFCRAGIGHCHDLRADWPMHSVRQAVQAVKS